jgi:thiamine biosynthesis lipoprotein
MRWIFFALAYTATITGMLFSTGSNRRIEIDGYAQGTTYHITYYAADSLVTRRPIDSILQRIDSSLSLYKPYSLITQFNKAARGIAADEHLVNVYNAAMATYKATSGLFDITVAPLVQAWGFGAQKTNTLPDSTAIQQIMPCIGSNKLLLQGQFIGKQLPCVQMDMNGIAQGYSVDVVANFLQQQGITSYIVEIGGELRIKGHKPNGDKMKIGIEAPPDNDTAAETMQLILALDSGAITTSGNYRKYYESGGKKISHLIDPRTGYSIQNEMISVTVYATDATTADAFDNALMVMGRDSALHFTEQHKNLAAYIIYRKPNGDVADTASTAFYALMHH